ncbi:MAG TPA: phosphoglycerate mutase family protein [Acidimicrobiales bacterium]|nr:phosphoglycerate mutase family protein [Acidimicrobiales bacterium]
MPLLLVRHANAGRRSAYTGDDRVRPLSSRGLAQADGLVPLLKGYRPRRILSSPYVRCCETVRPLSEALALPVETVDALAEGHGSETLRLMDRMAGESAVLCTHGDVALEVLDALAGQRPAKVRQSLRLQKGEVWVVQSAGTSLSIVEHLPQVTGRDR